MHNFEMIVIMFKLIRNILAYKEFEMIVILYKINDIYFKNIRTYFKSLVSLNLL